VDNVLDLVGLLDVEPATRTALVNLASQGGELRFGTDEEREQSASRIGRLLCLTVASREYQFA
jgi:hypothetical protein